MSSSHLAAVIYVVALAAACGSTSPTVNDDERLFQEGVALYDQQMYSLAAAKFDQLVAGYPDSPRHDNAGYLSGRCSYELLDFPAATTKLVAMRQAHPTSPLLDAAAYYTGRSRFRLLDYAPAIPDFRASVAADAAGVWADNAQYYLGRSAFESSDFATARVELAVVETRYSQSSYLDNARYYLGRAFFDGGDPNGAVGPLQRVFLTATSIYADSAQYFIGRSHYALGQLAVARADLQVVSSTYPQSQWVDNALGYEARIQADQLDCNGARATLGQLATQFPTSTETAPTEAYLVGKGC